MANKQFPPKYSIDALLWTLAREPAAELLLKAVVALLRAGQVSPELLQELRKAFSHPADEKPSLDSAGHEGSQDAEDFYRDIEPRLFGLIIGQMMTRDLEGGFRREWPDSALPKQEA